MPVRQPPPTFRKLPDPIFLGDFRTPETPVLSPTSPLECNLQSPKGWKNRNSDGIGLGILAALEKSGSNSVAPAKLIRASAPITIVSPAAGRGGSCIGMGPENCIGMTRKEMVFFCGSPPTVNEETAVFRRTDFLSHCYLCSKRLHGRDIYMYRGEKAFCSTECRHSQIVSDEFQEKCGIEASKSSTDISSSPYSSGERLFFTEIIAA